MSTPKKVRQPHQNVMISLPRDLHAEIKQWAKDQGLKLGWAYARAVETLLRQEARKG